MSKKTGRPSKRSPAVIQRILDGLSAGTPLTIICQPDDMPSTSTVYEWMGADEALSGQVARAREAGWDQIALDDRDQLTALLSVLGRELAKLPEREQAVAAQIASRTEELLATAAAPEPDRSRLRQLGDAVIGGVKLLGSAGPGVAETAEKVVALVSRIAG